MRLEIHVHVHGMHDSEVMTDPNIVEILEIVRSLQVKETEMALDLSALQTEITENNDIINSAVTLITGLAAAFQSAQGDPAAIAALTNQLSASADSLALAVAAGTGALPPAEEPTTIPPVAPLEPVEPTTPTNGI